MPGGARVGRSLGWGSSIPPLPLEALELPASVLKKKVHFSGDGKENAGRADGAESSRSRCRDLKKRLHAAQLRAQALSDLERNYQLRSRQILGMR